MDTDPNEPPESFGLRYIFWWLWRHPYDVIGFFQIIFGSIAGAAGGLPHPWGSIVLIGTGVCTNLLARFHPPVTK